MRTIMNLLQMLTIVQFIFQRNFATLDTDFIAYVNVDNPLAFGSRGYYSLSPDIKQNNEAVLTRISPDDPTYYIWKEPPIQHLNGWKLGRNLGISDGTLAGYCLVDPNALEFTPYGDVRDCNVGTGIITAFWFEYYVNAYASNGFYKLLGGSTGSYNGFPVYIRDANDGHPRYIYKAHGLWYIASSVGAAGVFSSCNKADLFECDWFVFCLNAYASNGKYYKTDQVYNQYPVYTRHASDGHPRYLYRAHGLWYIASSVGAAGVFASCNKLNFFECDQRIVMQECAVHGGLASDSYFKHFVNEHWTIFVIICSTITIFIILCIIKIIQRKRHQKNTYKMVSLQHEEEEHEEEESLVKV